MIVAACFGSGVGFVLGFLVGRVLLSREVERALAKQSTLAKQIVIQVKPEGFL